MKFEQVNAWKIVGNVAAAMALGAVATAQVAGGKGAPRIVRGQPFQEVSLEGDIRAGQPAGRKIVLERPDQRQLELKFKMRPHAGLDPLALIPVLEEMESMLVLENGTPGGMAVIHLDNHSLEVRRTSGTRIVGSFNDDGSFQVVLPTGFGSRGIFAHGEEVTFFGLVKRDAAGHAVPSSKRPVTEELDLSETATKAYFNWIKYFTDLQFRTDARMRGADLEAQSAELLAVASTPLGTQRALDKIVLQRPAQAPTLGGGHTKQGSGVEEIVNGEEPPIVEPPPVLVDPTGGGRAGEKIALQRPAQPTLGGGHTKQGSDVEEIVNGGEPPIVEPPPVLIDPVGGGRAGEKIKLHRPPTQRDNNVLQRRL